MIHICVHYTISHRETHPHLPQNLAEGPLLTCVILGMWAGSLAGTSVASITLKVLI